MIRTLAFLLAGVMGVSGFVALCLVIAEGEREVLERREYQ